MKVWGLARFSILPPAKKIRALGISRVPQTWPFATCATMHPMSDHLLHFCVVCAARRRNLESALQVNVEGEA